MNLTRREGPPMSVDAHRCVAAAACRRADTIDTKRCGALTEQPHTLCPACRTHIGSAVHQLPKDWAELRAALGERSPTAQLNVSSTPTPAILISTRKEALMAAIVDMADRAAATVSDRLHTGQPATYHGRGHPRHEQRTLTASILITEPNIDLLAAAPPEPAMVWKKPARCPTHEHLIASAEEAAQSEEYVRRAYTAAGACDDCNGWGQHGQERQLIEMSGLDITLQLVELHNQARAELGLTRLRHRYPMPCPRCGNRVGRDDGDAIITCDDRTTCRSSWTEREYQFLAGLITRERLDMEILKWLLTEAYWRLDKIRTDIDITEMGDTIEMPGAGRILADAITNHLADHKLAPDRAITTDRQATQTRQTSEDTWNWRNETPYQPPKRKPTKPVAPPDNPIHPGSLTTLVDIDADTILNGDARCRDCNLIHSGAECP